MSSEEQNQDDKKDEDTAFDWTDYLERTRGVKAPRVAFFQPHDMPVNRFKVGQLILAKDKHAHLMCLSKIRHVHKCWLYIHIEGLDETHCRWIMCDDRDLAPVGPKNDKLKVDNRDAYPPTGLKSNFKKWIVQQFKDQEDNIADISLFEAIALKYQPKGNQFEVGMKLAAYDEKSFDGKLSPATIVDVNKANLKLNFDGWPSSYDINVPFYSRCIFPIDFVQGAGLAINVPRIMPAPEPVKTPKEAAPPRRNRSSHSESATNSPSSENEEDNQDEPSNKRRRMGFFDASNKPMRPGQRAAAMKEQVTGVKAKVIDILREASEAQEREESRDPARNLPPKLVSMVPKVVRIEGGQVTTVHPVSDGNLRAIAPKPATIVYQNTNSGTIYVPKQSQAYAQSSVRTSAVQQVHPNEARVVTITRPKMVVPNSGLMSRMAGPATTVSTASGDFILADPNIKSALRQTLEDSNGNGMSASLGGLREDKEDPDARRPTVVARMQRNNGSYNDPSFQSGHRLPSDAERPKLSTDERSKMGWTTLNKPGSSEMASSSSQIKASPFVNYARAAFDMQKRGVTVRPLSHPQQGDPHGVRRMDHLGQASSSAARPVTVSAVRPLTSQGALIHMKKPLMPRPRVSIASLASSSREGQSTMRPLHSSPNAPILLANARNRPIIPPPPMPSFTQPPTIPDPQPPLDTKVKIDEYKRETRTVQKNLDDAIVQMYVNKGCQSGPMLDAKKVSQLRDYTSLPYHAQITKVVQDIIYCAWVPKEVFDMVKNVGPDAPGMKITILHGKEILTKTIPIHLSAISAFMWLRDFLTTLNCCPHLISSSEFSCESCDSTEKHAQLPGTPSASERAPKYKREYDVLKKLGAHLRSCEDVAREFRRRLGDDVAQMIIENQIDSSVLPFCQEDLLREQMKLPYNTALKIAAVACELRAAAFESVPGIDQMDLELK